MKKLIVIDKETGEDVTNKRINIEFWNEAGDCVNTKEEYVRWAINSRGILFAMFESGSCCGCCLKTVYNSKYEALWVWEEESDEEIK